MAEQLTSDSDGSLHNLRLTSQFLTVAETYPPKDQPTLADGHNAPIVQDLHIIYVLADLTLNGLPTLQLPKNTSVEILLFDQ